MPFNCRCSLSWKKYSNKEYEDDYPEGDPNGLNPELLISEFAIKNIILFLIKINNDNDKMNEIFNNCIYMLIRSINQF